MRLLVEMTDENKRYPKGIRQNNAGNIRNTSIVWQGEITDKEEFEVFDTPVHGLRALMKVLLSYNRKYGLNTVRAIINRWAPPIENDTGSYQEHVAKALGVGVDDVILLTKVNLIRLAQAITRHENGRPPKGYPFYWYEDGVYEEAASMALGLKNGD